jgi:hypothetical protein
LDREGDVVGAATLAQLDQHLEIELVVRAVEAAPKRLPAVADASHRVLFIEDRVGDLVRDHYLHGLAGIAPPGEGCAEILRVQRAGVMCHPQERHSCGDQAPHEFVKRDDALVELARRLEQPVGDIGDRVVDRALLGRTRHPVDDANVLGQKGRGLRRGE